MKWSPEQDRALCAVNDWLGDLHRQLFRLFGYAGTGKTTLARELASGVPGEVLFGAYTGKASHVLRQKGCVGASTIHSMLYHSKEKGRAKLKDLEASLAELIMELRVEAADGEDIMQHRRVIDLKKLIADERRNLSRPIFSINPENTVKDAALVVIDECSMVDGQMGEDLLSQGAKILVLGDPAQLPPVGGAGFFTEGVEPDFMLTDIHRQARDNPIIEMATRVRNKETLELGRYGESEVTTERTVEDALNADQILVGKNKTRHLSNERMRQLLGYEGLYPLPRDKLVCLRNNHEKGLLNGALWNVEDVGEFGEEITVMTLNPEDGGDPIEVRAHSHYFLGKADDLPWWERKEAEEFDYGYALTVHKSQGSQWDNVLLFDEAYCFRQDAWRWLYTGLTRAAEIVKVVRT